LQRNTLKEEEFISVTQYICILEWYCRWRTKWLDWKLVI